MKPDADDYFLATVDGEVTAVYVSPSAAGEGIGSQIYGELETYARSQGVDSLGLWASLNAVEFYAFHGFTRVASHVHEFHGGVEGTVVEMQKPLD